MIEVLLALALPLTAVQDTTPPPAARDTVQGALRVFLDCGSCDFDYLRTEITFVNYVRDRTVAQVHVLVTTQGAGGGTEFTLTLIGLESFAGRTDTLHYVSSQTDTPDERRRGMARLLKLGLARYAAGTPLASRLDVRYDGPAGDAAAQRRGRDRWNYWLFEVSTSANFNGEESQRSSSVDGSLNTSRITEAWKIRLSLDGSDRRNTFQLDDTTTFTTRRTSWSFEALVARSLGGHWAAGAFAEVTHSTYRNLDLRVAAAPALEFDVFPYGESTRRILTVRYLAGLEHSRYQNTTLFGLLEETRPVHRLEVAFSARQPWGNSSVNLEALQYLHDASKLRLSFNANARVRIVRGLSFNVFGGYEVVRDQLYLPAQGATPEEIIARQRALATNYSYFTGFGLGYTFGSIYNNVVNPRLR